jgi:hypothetical protein
MQNWNALLKYIKRKLGVPLNLIEVTDDDMVDIIKNEVIPALSQYVGNPIWFRLGPQHIKPGTFREENFNISERYIIPAKENNIILTKVIECYWPQYAAVDLAGLGYGIIDGIATTTLIDPRDAVMANTYYDMARHFSAAPTFMFIPPNELLIDMSLQGKTMIIEVAAIHDDLSTIPSDIYFEIFKEMCLAEILDTVAAMRKKYRNITTPFGSIELNWEELQTRADTLKTVIQEKLESLPPDVLLHWI